METPAHGLLRWLRSAALAVATVGLAATAHTVAGGDVPGVAAFVVLTWLTVLACVALTGRRRGLVSVVAAMTVLQVALHEGFMLLTPMACGTAAGGPVSHTAMHAAPPTMLMSCAAPGSEPSASHLSLSMLAAHAVATVVLAVVLARGERAVWCLQRLMVPALPLAPAATPWSTATQAVLPAHVVVPTAWTSVSSLVRRGPPSVPVVASC